MEFFKLLKERVEAEWKQDFEDKKAKANYKPGNYLRTYEWFPNHLI